MKYTLLAVAALALPALTACDSSDDSGLTVTGTVVADPQLSTLEAAVIEANLDEALAAENGSFTVFAPTDAAFTAALARLELTPAQLLANPELANILKLHVVATNIFEADDFTNGETLTTLNGQTLTVRIGADGRVGLDTQDTDTTPEAYVTTADIQTTNGIVHKIDAVLLPAAR